MKRLLVLCVIFFSHTVLASININTASEAELTSLNGINRTLAQAIIEFRQANGPFKTVEDLLKVKGITAVELSKIRDKISVGPSAVLPPGQIFTRPPPPVRPPGQFSANPPPPPVRPSGQFSPHLSVAKS